MEIRDKKFQTDSELEISICLEGFLANSRETSEHFEWKLQEIP